MDLADLIGDDFEIFDGVQTVTLVGADGTETSVAGVTTSPLSKQQASQVGQLLLTEDEAMSFSLPVANLNGETPEQGNEITAADGSLWNILTADRKTLGSRWICTCKKTRSAFALPSLTFTYDRFYSWMDGLEIPDGKSGSDNNPDAPTILLSDENKAGQSVVAMLNETKIPDGTRIRIVAQDGAKWPGDSLTALASDAQREDLPGDVFHYYSIHTDTSSDVLPQLYDVFADGDTLTLIFSEA